MSRYRINVRFDTDDEKQANAVSFLQSLQKSRNAFIVSAVLDAIARQSVNELDFLENIRLVIREELQEVSFAVTPPAFQSAKTELTEEQQAENERSVLDDLDMFG